jgi:7-keto-8-aminopelargonate synthetase-like enzyme
MGTLEMGSKQSTAAAAAAKPVTATTKPTTASAAENHAAIMAEANALVKRLAEQTKTDEAQLARNVAEATALYDSTTAAVSRLGMKRQTPAEKAAEKLKANSFSVVFAVPVIPASFG